MAKFSLMQKTVNLEQVEGKWSAFVKVPYALPVKSSKPIADDGYGKVTVNGIEISKGKTFFVDSIVKMNCMLLPVGEVAREFDREYSIKLSGFKATDGSLFNTQSFKFKTLPRREKSDNYIVHDGIALRAARESMVLLKNEEGTLPLKEYSILNCFGGAQYMHRNTATGASLINPRWQADFHQGVKEHSNFSVNEEVSSIYYNLKDTLPTDILMRNARRKSDIALIFISRSSGEFHDNRPIKGGYYLTDDEEKMIATVSKVFEKTVAIINTGYPIDVRWLEKYNIKSALYIGYAGMLSGYALAEILDGRANPSAKLTDTWPLDYYDNPSSKNFINLKEDDKNIGEKEKGVHLYYEEDIYVGYRYFDTFEKPVAYTFGHGLSFTSFSLQSEVETADIDEVRVNVTVTNTGNSDGKEVVQLYIAPPSGRLEKPKRVFSSFDKTKKIVPKTQEVLTLETTTMNFTSFDEETSSFTLEKGEYGIYIGNSLKNAEKISSFTIEKDIVVLKQNSINPSIEDFHKLTREKPFVNEDSSLVDAKDAIKVPAFRPVYNPKELKQYKGKKIKFNDLIQDERLLDDFVSQLSISELCRLNVSKGANWYMPWQDGSAGSTAPIKKYKIPSIKVSDGNSGVNIKTPNVGFPCTTNIASTFNRALVYEIGKAIGKESKENGINVNLGPAMNIHRNILNGRHPEYFSEDPILTGIMAGYQAMGLKMMGVGSTYKHLFCNNSDTSRKLSHSIVSERAMREIYYRQFQMAFSIQHPSCVMTSYNAVNGIYPSENADVLQKLVREEWGFSGMIMTDWGSYDTIDPVEMVKAGTCWLTEGGKKYVKILENAAREGKLSKAILQDNVKYVMKLIVRAYKR